MDDIPGSPRPDMLWGRDMIWRQLDAAVYVDRLVCYHQRKPLEKQVVIPYVRTAPAATSLVPGASVIISECLQMDVTISPRHCTSGSDTIMSMLYVARPVGHLYRCGCGGWRWRWGSREGRPAGRRVRGPLCTDGTGCANGSPMKSFTSSYCSRHSILTWAENPWAPSTSVATGH